MPNEEYREQAESVQNEAQSSQAAPSNEPTDLAEAFAQITHAKLHPTQDNVGNDEPAANSGSESVQEGTEPSGAGAVQEAGQEVEAGYTEPAATDYSGAEPGGSLGGSAAVSEPVDYTPAKEQILNGITYDARQTVLKRFYDNGIRPWSIDDVYERDESSGRVTYRNPDDPSHPFADRTKAQEFIDSINRQINDRLQREMRAEQRRLYNELQPTLNMIDFAPTYDTLNETEKGIFDDLITPYAVRNNQNQIVGFNVNLPAMANQARNIAARFANMQPAQQQEPPAQKQATSPAVDMHSGAGSVADDEPKTLGEAFRKVNENKKKGRK